MAIAANKTDLPPELHRVTLEHAKTVLAPFNCPIIETSAKVRPLVSCGPRSVLMVPIYTQTQTNVSLAFAEVIRRVRKARSEAASSHPKKKRMGCPLF